MDGETAIALKDGQEVADAFSESGADSEDETHVADLVSEPSGKSGHSEETSKLKGKGKESYIAENKAGRDFQELQRQIEAWVVKVHKDVQSSDHRKMIRHAAETTHSRNSTLMKLLCVNRRAPETDTSGDRFSSKDIALAKCLGHHPEAIRVVFSLSVWSALQKRILSKKFPIGVDKIMKWTLSEASKTMDKEKSYKRLSQAITKLAKTVKFQERRDNKIKSIVSELQSCWPLSHVPRHSMHRRRLKRLVEFAADFHCDLKCSGGIFDMVYPRKITPGTLPDDADSWNLLSLSRWLPIPRKEDSEGVLLCLYPGLQRRVAGDKVTLNVSKPTVLAYDANDVREYPRLNLTPAKDPSSRRKSHGEASSSRKPKKTDKQEKHKQKH
ncbi:hypothetical protein NOR_02109 [Metarhizium rileyi]|uniref:Uncharacterized protein n=1 Tax=Metarhizium rileyi (strain RCEF 4871) TaxID=1649241 RepID=A0A167H8Q1_METRR|nr:hypothetical protein NOR_02109 [Metarhizium rileyi RCEF 4871]